MQRQHDDNGAAGDPANVAKDKTRIVVEIVRRNSKSKGLKKYCPRWLVERTFA